MTSVIQLPRWQIRGDPTLTRRLHQRRSDSKRDAASNLRYPDHELPAASSLAHHAAHTLKRTVLHNDDFVPRPELNQFSHRLRDGAVPLDRIAKTRHEAAG